MHRTLSHTEIASALDCQARHDFRYGGHLAGTALRPKHLAPQLSEGRAWGRAMAAYHAHPDDQLVTAQFEAEAALVGSLVEDFQRQEEFGLADRTALDAMVERLGAMLEHYVETTERFPLTKVEHELMVNSRTPSPAIMSGL